MWNRTFARCDGFMGSEISVSPILSRNLLPVSAFRTSWPGASIMSGRGVGADLVFGRLVEAVAMGGMAGDPLLVWQPDWVMRAVGRAVKLLVIARF